MILMRKSLLLALMVLVGFVSQGQNILSEGFENGFPPSGWTSTNAGSGLAWSRTTAGTFPTQSPYAGSYEGKVNTFSVSSGTALLITPVVSFNYTSGSNTVSFWMYRDNGYNTSADKIDVYVNTTAATAGGTVIGTVNRAIGLSPTVSANGWYYYSFPVPGTYNTSTNYVIFAATSAYGNDIYVDEISIDHLPPCTGTISGGTASASPNPVCANVAINLSDVGYTVGSGMTYQWQSSPAGANTWTNISGATTPVYTLAAGITAATDFRFVATCATVTTPGVSNTVAVTLNPPANCYCSQAASSTVDDDIGQVVYGTFSNPTTAPSPLTGNTSSTGTYTNYTALGPIKVIAGAPTTFQVTQINSSGSYYTCYLKAFIDINGNGSWLDAGEQVFAQAGLGSPASPSFSGTITIPSSTPPITTRMRVSLQESGSATSVTPCNTYTWGETEDYTVKILSSTPPPPTLVHNAPLCPGGTLTFTAADTGGYPTPTFTLYGPGLPASGVAMPGGVYSIPNVTTAASGTYYATETSGGNTSTVQTPTNPAVLIYPVANLVPGTITGTTTCTSQDGAFQLTGLVPNASYTLTYTPPTGPAVSKTITASATGTYTESALFAGTYTNVKVTNNGNGGCVSNSISISVPPPNAPPTPIVTYQQPLCPGSTLQLSVSSPNPNGTYTWTTTAAGTWNNPTPGSGPTATRNNMTSAQNGSYCAKVTVNGCVSALGCVTVTVNAKDPKPTGPGIAPNNPIQYCQFDVALPLTASGVKDTFYGPWQVNPINPSGPLYTGPDSAKIYRLSITPRTDIATGPGQAFVYGVTQTQTCQSDTAYILVQIKPRPPKPAVQSPLEFCQFSPANALSASGQNIRWFTTPTGGVGTATAPTPGTLVSGTYYYYVSQTVNGCESDRSVIAVTVKPKPAPPKVTSPLNLCQGDPVGPLTAIGQNLLWYTAASGGVGVPVAPIPNTGYEDSFKYWVSQTVNGCESDRALIQAYVRYKPNGVIVGSSQWVCQDADDSFFYYGNARPDAEFIWFSPFPQTHAVAGKNGPGPFIVHFDSAGTQVIRLQINNKGCISTLISAPITVRHLPAFDYTVKRDVCKDELVDISLLATEPGISTYAFSFGNTTDTTMVYAAPPGGPFGIRYHTAGDYIVSATATLNECTSKPLDKRITVHDLPNAGIKALAYDPKSHTLAPFDPKNDVICSSDTLVLSVLQVPEGATYTWTPAAYFQSLRDTLNYIVRAVISHSSPVKVNVTTAYGCVGEDSIVVNTKPCCGVYFPTAFAPEGNVDRNRTFKPITIGFHEVNNFRVVNRWGQTVFETKNERIGWDGTYNGVKQDMGVYYYYINYKCEGKNMEEHGEVTLMR
jgi:gliding motility-associated-like protein